MGGDQNIEELYDLCKQVKDNGLKVCIYSGMDSIEAFTHFICDSVIDYLKIGSYQEELGGLNNINTNQHMYKIIGTKTLDITNIFQKPKI
jgi:anaerobic ribonucleoside-triphosphate reductase activating protein